jgi:hypothetical protein
MDFLDYLALELREALFEGRDYIDVPLTEEEIIKRLRGADDMPDSVVDN